jgi:hypothetical protein
MPKVTIISPVSRINKLNKQSLKLKAHAGPTNKSEVRMSFIDEPMDTIREQTRAISPNIVRDQIHSQISMQLINNKTAKSNESMVNILYGQEPGNLTGISGMISVDSAAEITLNPYPVKGTTGCLGDIGEDDGMGLENFKDLMPSMRESKQYYSPQKQPKHFKSIMYSSAVSSAEKRDIVLSL